jgi:hypothetical protein
MRAGGQKLNRLLVPQQRARSSVYEIACIMVGRGETRSILYHRPARGLPRSSGILAGPSTGATLAVALRVARDAAPNSNIVFIACDAGWKYFSAGLGDGNLDEMEDALEGDVFWW